METLTDYAGFDAIDKAVACIGNRMNIDINQLRYEKAKSLTSSR